MSIRWISLEAAPKEKASGLRKPKSRGFLNPMIRFLKSINGGRIRYGGTQP